MAQLPHPKSYHPILNSFDLELIRLLSGDLTLLSGQQISQLFPYRSRRNINYRIRRLLGTGYLSCRLFPATYRVPKLPLYLAGPKAVEPLGKSSADPAFLAHRRRALQMSDGAIPHFLLIESVYIKFFTAQSVRENYELLSWIPPYDPLWNTLNQYGFPLRPDAYLEVRLDNNTLPLFLEIDTGTERGLTIRNKLRAYHDYANSGRFQHHFSAPTFRVLLITDSPRRARHLLRLATPYPPDLFWMSTLAAFFDQPLLHAHWLLHGSDIPLSLATPL